MSIIQVELNLMQPQSYKTNPRQICSQNCQIIGTQSKFYQKNPTIYLDALPNNFFSVKLLDSTGEIIQDIGDYILQLHLEKIPD